MQALALTPPPSALPWEVPGLLVSPRPKPGFRFTERMVGHLCPAGTAPSLEPCRHGPPDEQDRIVLTLTIVVDDLQQFLTDHRHTATLLGTVECPALSRPPLVLTGGKFGLFRVDPDRVERRTIDYVGTLTATSREKFLLWGFKDIYNHPRVSDAWSDLTTLHFGIDRIEPAGPGRYPRCGVARVSPAAFMKQLTTLRAVGAASLAERLDTVAEFLRFFGGTVRDTYGRIFARAMLVTPDAPPPPPKSQPPAHGFRRPEPRSVSVTTDDGVTLNLTRYRGGFRGPVLLVPGFGMTSKAFVLDTIPCNLVDYLCRNGYDVWLFDPRWSPDLGAASTSYTIDDIARRDYPAAVQKVLDQTGATTLQVVAHCVGALSLLMSLTAGKLTNQVRLAICSQLGLHPITDGINETKAGLGIAWLLRALGSKALTATYDERRWSDWLIDRTLRLYPSRERCNNPLCRRVLFLFGESYKHERLTTATHEALRDLFGRTSPRALQHLALMVRRKQAVNRQGENIYLSNLSRLENVPIAFMHGEANRQFLPGSTEKTFNEIRKFGKPHHTRKTFPCFGHLDCFVGYNAESVFAWILGELNGR